MPHSTRIGKEIGIHRCCISDPDTESRTAEKGREADSRPFSLESTMSLRSEFDAKGVYVFVMTPFKDGKNTRGQYVVDLAGLEKNISVFSRVPGDKAMVVCGGSGEIHSLSAGEVIDVAAAAVSGADARCPVVCGVRGPDRQAARSARARSPRRPGGSGPRRRR